MNILFLRLSESILGFLLRSSIASLSVVFDDLLHQHQPDACDAFIHKISLRGTLFITFTLIHYPNVRRNATQKRASRTPGNGKYFPCFQVIFVSVSRAQQTSSVSIRSTLYRFCNAATSLKRIWIKPDFLLDLKMVQGNIVQKYNVPAAKELLVGSP